MAIIDQSGTIWRHPADLVWQAFGAPAISPTLLDRLLFGGCVSVDLGHSLGSVRLAPAHLTTEAFCALDRLLDGARPGRIRLTWHHRTWHDEISPSPSAARKRLIELAGICRAPDGFYSSIYDDHDGGSSPHAPVAALWRSTGGDIDLREHSAFIATHVGRFLTAFDDDGTIRFGSFGPDWHIYKSRRWLTHCIGRAVEDQPDVEYGTWVAGNYAAMMDISAPVTSINDVTVTDPTGDGSKRIAYRRLNVPVIGVTGRRELLTVSFNDPSIDLRPPVREV